MSRPYRITGPDAAKRMQQALEGIRKYQATSRVHPLTCGYCDERERLLKPEQNGSTIVLVCPACKGRQVVTEDLAGVIDAGLRMSEMLDDLFKDY